MSLTSKVNPASDAGRCGFIVVLSTTFCLLMAASLIWHQPPVNAQAKARSSAWAAVNCSEFKLTVAAGSKVECGYVTVPKRHAHPNAETIRLATVIIPTDAADKRPDPFFIAQGGPGGSSINTYAGPLITMPNLRPVTNRDIVLWDQRGTLYSQPALMCPELSEAGLKTADSDAKTQSEASQKALQACGARLKKEVGDISAFNSAENAHDIEALRVALGYDQINFYGVSYGTELGQFAMREHPQHLRSVVLDGVVPLSYNLFTEPAHAMERIGEKYFNACANDAKCNAAYPNLGKRYMALVERLNANPATITIDAADAPSGPVQVKLTGNVLESTLYEALYLDAHELIPMVIDSADKGDYTFVSGFLLPLALFDKTMAEGMHLSVACAEHADKDPNTADFSNVVPRLAQKIKEDAQTELAICRDWGIELLPREMLTPIKSEIPTLLLSGDFDPITPPPYAQQLLPTLPNAKHVIFPLGSHGQAVSNPCANGIINSFVENPRGNLDASCTKGGELKFLTANDIIIIPGMKKAVAASGLSGLMTLALESAPGLIAGLLLLLTIPLYFIAWLIGKARHKDTADGTPGWTRTMSRLAPWLVLAVGVLLLLFFLGLYSAINVSLSQSLLYLGAVPASTKSVFLLPLVITLLVVLMVIVTVAIWKGHHRSIIGRLSFTVLTLLGVASIIGFYSMGVLGLWRG